MQDFYAKVFIMTTTAVFEFPVEERLKREHSNKKLSYKVNRTNALSLTKEMSYKIFIRKMGKVALNIFDKILTSTVEAVRPNRKNERKKIRKPP